MAMDKLRMYSGRKHDSHKTLRKIHIQRQIVLQNRTIGAATQAASRAACTRPAAQLSIR
ncbi:MAG TPA: hypothetical protein VFK82_02080 [Burkholderiaceae bacterium]|nr:hypothetical protein [Burkholderiaceae bacterium]